MNDDHLIFETAHFRCNQFQECPMPGYLLLRMKEPVDSFARLTPDVACGLGIALAAACRIIEEVIRPERVYVGRYGEILPALHFHLFPRTARVLEHYRAAHPGQTGPPSGPHLFEWARTHYGSALLPAVPAQELTDAIHAMRWQLPRPGAEE